MLVPGGRSVPYEWMTTRAHVEKLESVRWIKTVLIWRWLQSPTQQQQTTQGAECLGQTRGRRCNIIVVLHAPFTKNGFPLGCQEKAASTGPPSGESVYYWSSTLLVVPLYVSSAVIDAHSSCKTLFTSCCVSFRCVPLNCSCIKRNCN